MSARSCLSAPVAGRRRWPKTRRVRHDLVLATGGDLTIYARRVAGGSRAGTADSGSAENGEATKSRQDRVTDLTGPGTDPGTMAGRRRDGAVLRRPKESHVPGAAYFTGDTGRAEIEFGSRAGFGGGALTSSGPSFSIASCSFNVASGAT